MQRIKSRLFKSYKKAEIQMDNMYFRQKPTRGKIFALILVDLFMVFLTTSFIVISAANLSPNKLTAQAKGKAIESSYKRTRSGKNTTTKCVIKYTFKVNGNNYSNDKSIQRDFGNESQCNNLSNLPNIDIYYDSNEPSTNTPLTSVSDRLSPFMLVLFIPVILLFISTLVNQAVAYITLSRKYNNPKEK